jgi:hypothetical protein
VKNTLVLYDDLIRQLNAAADLADVVEKLHPDKSSRDIATHMKAKSNGAELHFR